jgi:RNA polymerase sigma-70 factor (ECF subfamily)
LKRESGSPPDEELVRRARDAAEADLRAYDQLVIRHQAEILANCRFISGSADDAEDLAQEVFIKAYQGLSRFEERARFRTWLQRIKVNHCLNYVRKKRRRVFVDIEDVDSVADPALRIEAEEHAGEKIGDAQIKAVLDALPDTLRIPLVLADVDELSYDEVSRLLGLRLSATKMRIKRARESFRRNLERRRPSTTAARGEVKTVDR